MAAVGGDSAAAAAAAAGSCRYLQRFRLYETRSNFYILGRDKGKTLWRLLKIDRTEPSELIISEDPTMYSESECRELLIRLNEGNMPTGGLKFVTDCYGIIGFAKFLEPYYMLLVTKRTKIGTICGHAVYGIAKSEIITIPNSGVQSNLAYSKDENRYKKLLCTLDLTKDFFFSYSYHVMRSLQKNFCGAVTGQLLYETMFVWNEYLTRGIRSHLKNTTWTVALVYGFFKQDKLSVSGKDFFFTLIARRSRFFAGTRYLKRGVNEKGRVANDVEIEQIVSDDKEGPQQIASIVQNRGSIPLFWSQETSWRNIKPDIILHKKDEKYEATRLHFENLVKRYGNPIIILNLIKTRERKPRESILRTEFAKAITYINKDLPEENRLKFLHWDLHKHSRRKATNVLALLSKVAAYALDLTSFFYFQMTPAMRRQSSLKWPILVKDKAGSWSYYNHNVKPDELVISEYGSHEDNEGSLDDNDNEGSLDGCASESPEEESACDGTFLAKPPMFQQGVLRTNCIDCLDRTNVAQYAYGLVSLGRQLHAFGLTDSPIINQDDPLANVVMHFYELTGDTLAQQYGGSAAHNKIFCETRGQWRAATQSQELFRTLQRYYSNTYMDAEKQDAINVFLGYFQPQQGRPALWELGSDQLHNIGKLTLAFVNENARSFIKRSLSDGNILCENNTAVSTCIAGQQKVPYSSSNARVLGDAIGLSDSSSEISIESGLSNSRQFFAENGFREHAYLTANCSNFLDLDWLSSSGNSVEEEVHDRSSVINSPVECLSSENVIDAVTAKSTPTASEKGEEPTSLKLSCETTPTPSHGDLYEFPDTFARWVGDGLTLSN